MDLPTAHLHLNMIHNSLVRAGVLTASAFLTEGLHHLPQFILALLISEVSELYISLCVMRYEHILPAITHPGR